MKKNNHLILFLFVIFISISASKCSLEVTTGVSEEQETCTSRGGCVDRRPILTIKRPLIILRKSQRTCLMFDTYTSREAVTGQGKHPTCYQ